MIDITQLVIALLGVIISVITVIFTTKLLPIIKQKYNENNLELIKTIIKTFVQAAEQIYEANEGAKKKDYVLSLVQKELESRGLTLDIEVLSGYIEAEVIKLKKALSE